MSQKFWADQGSFYFLFFIYLFIFMVNTFSARAWVVFCTLRQNSRRCPEHKVEQFWYWGRCDFFVVLLFKLQTYKF